MNIIGLMTRSCYTSLIYNPNDNPNDPNNRSNPHNPSNPNIPYDPSNPNNPYTPEGVLVVVATIIVVLYPYYDTLK